MQVAGRREARHVLAPAVHGGASLIVTFKLGDFPATVLGRHQVEAIHPDDFVVRLWDESAESVLEAARRQRAGLRRPPKTTAEYLATLEQCRLIEAAARLRLHEDQL